VSTRCIEGFNVSLVSYGLAGSGKSHTVFGAKGDKGIIELTVEELFAVAKKKSKKWDYSLSASMIEVYEDELTDLFASEKKKLVLKKDVKGLVHVVNAQFTNLTSPDLLMESISKGLKKRDEMGHNAAKSNLFVSVLLECNNKESGIVNIGRIVFSDLVGCDTGDGAMTSLHSVVDALETEQPEIPYTTCKVAKYLSDCLGGNSKTLVLVHVKPDESLWEDAKQVSVNWIDRCLIVATGNGDRAKDPKGEERHREVRVEQGHPEAEEAA